ncbi:MAG: Eco57I restriction-modification methylase domain-containing protein [Methanomicrobia archaeon]|nr:Eco57I restriction-modification methylase domain-containing protein [Methanomicrobia archaeon]
MVSTTDWRRILPVLQDLNDIETLRRLFIDELNYDYENQDLVIEYPESIREAIHSTKIIAEKGAFKIVLCNIETLLKGIELHAVKAISRYYLYNLIVFTNPKSDEFHFVNTKYIGGIRPNNVRGFRRITVGKTERLRTAADRLARIFAPEGIAPSALMAQCEDAFDVEAVSKAFYEEFVKRYKDLRDAIKSHNRLLDKKDADKLTQEITNRLIFLYFIQKKGWLNQDYSFLYNGFTRLNSENREFYKEFLVPLFKRLSDPDFDHPEFETIPFLNGGLFEFDDGLEGNVTIPNDAFKSLFDDLLERFNFTIREDTEYEEEVAIDPEMLGRIFEQLILSLESEQFKDIPDPRRASGSYYTPRFIVSFMVKQALLNYLVTELPQIPREALKALVFELSTEGIDDPALVKEKLLVLKIVDPGVGSGAFSVDILNKLVSLIEKLNEHLGTQEERYYLRKKLIEDCIYGVDCQERAVHLARLRLWLSLIVDIEVEDLGAIPPLINLDFKIVRGNSLVSKICGFSFDLETQLSGKVKKSEEQMRLLGLRGKYNSLKLKYAEAITAAEKEKLKSQIDKTRREITIWVLERIRTKKEKDLKAVGAQRTLVEKSTRELANEERLREAIKQELSDIDEKIREIKAGKEIDAFNWELNFFEVMDVSRGGFDIVIANPPYGVAVDKSISNAEFGLGSKDSYGVFAALGVNILKPGGTLCYIMSDTWQTIRTHYPLRKKLFEETKAQYLISVPMRTFKATVNTGIYLFKKSAPDKIKNNFIIAADFHGRDIKTGDLETAFDTLIQIEPDETAQDGYTIISDEEKAIYVYRQKMIKRFSNLSFFIASPKLFALMDDTTNVIPGNPPVMSVKFNGKAIELVRLGNIAKVLAGLQTSDNKYYLRQFPNTKGSNYREIDLSLVLKEEELEKIREDEKLKQEIIEKGISTNPIHQHRYFGGRYFVPYDKGGASDVEEGWLPNYYVPTPYFIDWSEKAVKNLLEGTLIRAQSKKPYPRNIRYYFKEGISFSSRGLFSPTFRLGSISPFDKESSCIFVDNEYWYLGLLSSKFAKFIFRSYIQHTVSSDVDSLKKIIIPFNISNNKKIEDYVISIISTQKQNPKYDYMTNEQLEIDKRVYELYNLNEEDIQEVENWYYRRYPKLAHAIEERLKAKNNG